jgi:dolichyl-phosphate-mannose-protein mannosyltransferase
MTRTCKQLFPSIFLLQAGFFMYVSWHRLIDGDEGFYLLASRLVMQRKAPYLDFFYTQAPLLPYVYGLWFQFTGFSWSSARTFSALLTAILGTLVYEQVCRETEKWRAGVAVVLLFTSSSLVFAWMPIVKTFPLATPCLFGCYMILARLKPSTSFWQLAIAGVLFGLSVDTRSYVVAVAPVLVWWILRQKGGNRLAWLLWAVGGFIIGTIPSLILFFASPDAFLFNNLGYHAMRAGDAGLIGDWQDKFTVLAATFGGRFTGFQFSVLVLTCVGMLITRRMKREASRLAFVIAAVLGFVSLLPTPASMQYFSMIVPFLLVAAVCSVNDYLAGLQIPRQIRMVRAACAIVLLCFVGFAIPSFRQYLFTGYKVPGLSGPRDAPNWTLAQVAAVSRAIDDLTQPGEQVISFWPGYLFASHANPYPGYENDFGMYVARRLPAEKRDKYHILTGQEMIETLEHHRTPLVVIGNQGARVGGPDPRAAAAEANFNGYVPVRKVGDTAIYRCCAGQ